MRRNPVTRPLVALLAAASLAGCELRSEGVSFVRIASGPAGGAWYPLGAKIAQVLGESVPEISTSSMPGSGEANLREVARRSAEIAFTYSSSAYDAYEGRGAFEEPLTDLRHFATLYPAALQTAVRRTSNVDSYDDLVGRSLSPGQVGMTGTVIAEEVLGAYGVTFDAVRQAGGAIHHVDYADSGALMKDGHVDAFMAVSGVPLATMMELNFQPGIRLLPVEPERMQQILASNPALIETVIPAGSYEGQTEDVPTIGVATVLAIHKDVPEEQVYQMAKALWESHAQLLEVSHVWEDVRLEDALRAVAIPVHPGAQRYYDEVGVTRP